ncbi:hypothetical protein I6G82_06670 [Lysinibacillus macroides]|nr:hypothetical protein I6G82_06670 [Lysinibacillus macroides]
MDDVRLVIQNAKNGVDLKGYNDSEQEVLYKRGTRFKVIDIQTVEDKLLIILEEYDE